MSLLLAQGWGKGGGKVTLENIPDSPRDMGTYRLFWIQSLVLLYHSFFIVSTIPEFLSLVLSVLLLT